MLLVRYSLRPDESVWKLAVECVGLLNESLFYLFYSVATNAIIIMNESINHFFKQKEPKAAYIAVLNVK